MDQSNMTILNSNVPIHAANVLSHPKRKNNRHNHGNLQTERLTLGDEAKMVSFFLSRLFPIKKNVKPNFKDLFEYQ